MRSGINFPDRQGRPLSFDISIRAVDGHTCLRCLFVLQKSGVFSGKFLAADLQQLGDMIGEAVPNIHAEAVFAVAP